MLHRNRIIYPLLLLLVLALLATACGTDAGEPAPSPTTPPPIATPTAVPTGTPPPEETAAPDLAGALTDPLGILPGTIDELTEAIAQRTPEPTPLPDVIARMVDDVAADAGLEEVTFLGLSGERWLNILASLLIIIIGTLLANFLLLAILRWIVRLTPFSIDNHLLDAMETPIRWFVLVVVARIAVLRLDVWSDRWVAVLNDFFFFAILGAVLLGAFRLTSFTATWYRDTRVPPDQRSRVAPMVTIFTRLGYLLFLVVAGALALGRLGVNVTLLSAVLLFVGLVVGLGARDAISDAVSGAFFLLDQRFRIGDDIYMQELDTRGTVVEVGIRQTRLQTFDNNIAIIPNSLIASSQILNYSVPDPSYRLHTIVGISYDAGLDESCALMEQTVREVEGVLVDRPIDVYFMEFGDWARIMRVYWWVSGEDDRFRSISTVNKALERALDAAGIEMPFQTFDVNLKPPPGSERS